MALCTFCGNPAAHPATGSTYGPHTLACASCTREFWKWLQQHTKGKGRRKGPGFYEHVKAICPTCKGRFSRGERCPECLDCPACCAKAVQHERLWRKKDTASIHARPPHSRTHHATTPTRDTRLRCPYCGMRTWSKDYVQFMRDHDRPDGRVCKKAQQSVPTPKPWTPNWLSLSPKSRTHNRAAPFAPPKFTGHKERSKETIGGYPVGTDFGWYVRATARELEKLVRRYNTGDDTLNQQQIDYTVSKSLMRCGEHMKQNFSTGKTPEWAAKNTYRLCVEQIYWPWPIRNMPYGPAGRYEFGARSRRKR